MLVNINEDILKLLKLEDLEDLEETEGNKEMIENVVNSYLVGGIYAAILQEASNVNKEEIENLMNYYSRKILEHIFRKLLNKAQKNSLF